MRYSTMDGDEGVETYRELLSQNKVVHTYLDGEYVKEVFTVDTNKGYILKACLPLSIDDNGNIKTEELFGNVTIKIKKRM